MILISTLQNNFYYFVHLYRNTAKIHYVYDLYYHIIFLML